MEKKSSDERKEVKFPLGVKLAIIIGLIVVISLSTVTYLNSYFVGQDVKITAENSNLEVNTRAASTVNDKLSTIRSNVFQLLDLIGVVTGGREASLSKQAQAFFFERNQDISSIYILSENSMVKRDGNDMRIINNSFFVANEMDSSVTDTFLEANQDAIARSCNGETIALNASPFFNIPVMALFFPWKENGRAQTCIITFSIETVSDILGSNSVNTTFMVNDKDELLSHPETDRVLYGESLKNDPLVQEMRNSNENNNNSRQVLFQRTNENNKKESLYGAYQRLSLGDIVILTTVPLDSILEGVRTTRRNNIYLTLIVLFISIISILCFSRFAISRHLRKLTIAADCIQNGNFDYNEVINITNKKTTTVEKFLASFSTKRADEIGVLNQSTQNEFIFLDIFSKFTNKGVAKAIATKAIDFDPHLKDVTIFFSDIRGFTAISDGFKNRFGNDSPKEIISFLNDYMSRMVNCVTLSHGTIDKFEGDAIMAVWGILRDDDLSFESLPDSDPTKAEKAEKHLHHVKEDAVNAITGVIAMRYSLMKYNKDAEAFTALHANDENAKYKPFIRIGCGLNTGRATAGIMGSEDKMEYTAIGDSVNFASRTESSNKPCGTDILITQDTYNLLKQDFIKCPENNFTINKENKKYEIIAEMIPVEFEVKGKGIQHFYGVVNMPSFDIEEFFKQGDSNFIIDEDCATAVGPNGPKTLNEVRTILGIPIPDFEKVNLNAEENKIQAKK